MVSLHVERVRQLGPRPGNVGHPTFVYVVGARRLPRAFDESNAERDSRRSGYHGYPQALPKRMVAINADCVELIRPVGAAAGDTRREAANGPILAMVC